MKYFDVDIYDTGDETNWIFNVFKDEVLVGECDKFKTKQEAYNAAKQFITWFVI